MFQSACCFSRKHLAGFALREPFSHSLPWACGYQQASSQWLGVHRLLLLSGARAVDTARFPLLLSPLLREQACPWASHWDWWSLLSRLLIFSFAPSCFVEPKASLTLAHHLFG